MERIINEDTKIVCRSYSTRSAWGHIAICEYKGKVVESVKVRYYNRTWERYQYESAMLLLVDKLDKNNTIPLKDRYAMVINIKQ